MWNALASLVGHKIRKLHLHNTSWESILAGCVVHPHVYGCHGAWDSAGSDDGAEKDRGAAIEAEAEAESTSAW